MLAAKAMTLASSELLLFPPPPHRPNRPERRTRGLGASALDLIRSIRRTLALAADEPGTAWLPRISNYPY